MPELSWAKSAQLLSTGVLLVLLGSGLFGLLYVIHGKNYEFGDSDIFNRKAAFWIGIPIIVSGLVGVLAGITKKNALVTLYMFSALVSTVLAGFASIGYGFKVTDMRISCGEDGSCRNSDTAVLIGTIVLLASLVLSVSIWGAVKACQAKWGPAKKTTSRVRVGHIQYIRPAANGQAATTTTTPATLNNVSNAATTTTTPATLNNVSSNVSNAGRTCCTCGGVVNPAISPVQPDNNANDEQNNPQNPRYESLDPASKTSTEYETLQLSETAKDDGSPEKDDSREKETQDLNTTTTTTRADYETMDDDVQGKEEHNEGFESEECSTAL